MLQPIADDCRPESPAGSQGRSHSQRSTVRRIAPCDEVRRTCSFRDDHDAGVRALHYWASARHTPGSGHRTWAWSWGIYTKSSGGQSVRATTLARAAATAIIVVGEFEIRRAKAASVLLASPP